MIEYRFTAKNTNPKVLDFKEKKNEIYKHLRNMENKGVIQAVQVRDHDRLEV